MQKNNDSQSDNVWNIKIFYFFGISCMYQYQEAVYYKVWFSIQKHKYNDKIRQIHNVNVFCFLRKKKQTDIGENKEFLEKPSQLIVWNESTKYIT